MQAQKSSTWVPRDQSKLQNTPPAAFVLSTSEKLSIMEALDHIHVARRYQEMGSCSACKKICVKKCAACGTFYCSNECQTYDWPKHRVVCWRQRESGSDRNNLVSSKQNRTESLKNLSDENVSLNDRGSPFTALANQLNKKSGSDYGGSKSLANFKIGNSRYQNKEQISKASEAGNPLSNGAKDYKKSNTFDRKKNIPPKKPFISKKSPIEESKGNGNHKNQGRNNPSFGKFSREDNESVSSCDRRSQSKVPKIERLEVVGTYRESAERHWVMSLNDLDKYGEIQNDLNTNSELYESVDPEVGTLYSCSFANEWFRGKVVSLTPEISVHFIDFGNTSKYEHDVVKKLPDNFKSIPGLAFLIEFDENTSSYYRNSDLESMKFAIEKIAVASDGVPRVRIIGDTSDVTENEQKKPVTEENKNVEATSCAKGSVVDSVTSTTSGMIILLPGKEKIRYGSLVPDDSKDANESVEKVLSIDSASASPFQAQVGEYVLVVDKEGNDQRGKVFSIVGSTYFVQLIDCGNSISTDKVYPLPEDLARLVHLGVKITIGDVIEKSKMEDLETCFFTVTGEADSGKWACTLKDSELEVVANVLLEKPTEREQWRPQYVDLKSGSTVEVSSSVPPNHVFIRVVDGETEQQFLDMSMEMIQFAPEGKKFTAPPLPGEMVCAKFLEDGCFYRGIVNSIESGRAGIMFVDFGNEQVKLSKVSQKPWNNMIKEYIGKLISENIELTVTYEGPLENGVTLREKVSGTVVNEFMEKARDQNLASNLLKSEPDLSAKSEIFLDEDLTYTLVPLGVKCDIIILYVSEYEFETNQMFWATRAGAKNFEYVNAELGVLISEHCSLSAPYEPGYRELCLAEFEGSWYRAVCAGSKDGVFKVFFVDFGNFCELRSTSIRKMVKKFMKAPALAMSCIIHGHEILKRKPELTEKVCGMLLQRVNTVVRGVEVSIFDKDTFLVKIPDVEKILTG